MFEQYRTLETAREKELQKSHISHKGVIKEIGTQKGYEQAVKVKWLSET